MNSAVQERLLSTINDVTVQAVLLHGPSASTQSTLLAAVIPELRQAERFLIVPLHLPSALELSRTEFFQQLAASIVAVTNQGQTLLATLSPTHFHTDFMEQIMAGLPPAKVLLFVIDGVDFQERSQLSKLNNLFLPLLRRLARLARLKFVLAVNASELAQIQALLHPIFASVAEIELLPPAPPNVPPVGETGQVEEAAEPSPDNGDHPTAPAVTEQEKPAPSTRRRPWLLLLLIVFNLVLLGNLYLLFNLLRQLAR